MSRIKITIAIAALALSGCVAQPSPNSSAPKPVVSLDAVLPPQSLLAEDTVTALTHDRSESRLSYVGVWATDGDKCAMMDQTQFDGFAVITPDSIRQSGGACTFGQGQPGSDTVGLDATCGAKGKKTTKKAMTVQMLSSQSMRLADPAGSPGVTMVRCRLLQ